MSLVLDNMIKDKKGYRTENYSGSGVRDLYDVIRYEISMGNTDIITYMQEEYDVLSDYVLEPEQIDELKEEAINDEEFVKDYNDTFYEMVSENSGFITDNILDYVCDKLGVSNENDLIALWLTDYDNAVNYYNNGSTEDIDEYSLDKEYVVLSDLGTDGSLFVFKR